MKLVFVIKSMAATGGAERVLATVASGLARRGHDVTVISYDPETARQFYALEGQVQWIGLGAGRTDAKASAVETLSRIRLLRRTIRSLRPDVAVGFMHSVFVPLALAMAGTRVPVVASEHIGFHHYESLRLERLLLRLSRPFLVATTVISAAIQESFPPSLRKRTVVIPNPVEPFAGGDPPGPGTRSKLLLSVARLQEQKDHKTLIAAFARIADQFPDWSLEIFGQGELRSALERQIAELGMEERIQLRGTTPDIGAEYRRADLFVMPSLYESFGLATAEALSCSVPAIGFADCPGTNEVIQDGRNGLLVSGPDRVAALAEGMTRLMGSPELRKRLGEAGPASIAPFRADAVAMAWEKLLARVSLRGQNPSPSD